MSNLENITSKIKKDAEVQKDLIIAKANESSKLIINKKESAAKKDAADLLEKSKHEAITKKSRILSSANLKVRNDKLVAKQTVISSVFDETKKKLNNMTDVEFKSFITDKILNSDIIGDEYIIVNEDKKKVVNEIFISELNTKLVAGNKKGELKISDINGNFEGGFIIEREGIEINNTFDSLIDSLKDEMEFEIAKVMFS
ncbi:V-type ATP synthase subunit E [uncultured Clostridium sp.]|jgi:V/A-type H+-transporting ATPase subunit E|uniref:V-type ATP synthase subunit E n=1 Tax=uncultured Clostridium sp. TaxID=59620 RepID=UPI002612CB20|nr:V-type ATP synthase subunit E [uncultured Clostridium sp.]